MFGLNQLFQAIARLTQAINRSADLFDTANSQLELRLAVDVNEDVPTLPAPEGNSRKARARS